MITVGVKQLKDNLSGFLQKVENGEVVLVSRHGKSIAELRPVFENKEQETIAELRRISLITGGSGKIRQVKSIKNQDPGSLMSDMIADERR